MHWSPKIPGLLASCSFDRSVAVHSLHAAPGAPEGSNTAVNPAAVKRAPRWLRRPCSASFGFGGRLVTVVRGGVLSSAPPAPGAPVHRGVTLSVVSTPTDAKLVAGAEAFLARLAANNLPGVCEEKAAGAKAVGADADAAVWEFMRVVLDASQRHSLLQYLGHSSEGLKAEVDAYASGAAPPQNAVKPSSPPMAPSFSSAFEHSGTPVKSAEDLFGSGFGGGDGFDAPAPPAPAPAPAPFAPLPPPTQPLPQVALAAVRDDMMSPAPAIAAVSPCGCLMLKCMACVCVCVCARVLI